MKESLEIRFTDELTPYHVDGVKNLSVEYFSNNKIYAISYGAPGSGRITRLWVNAEKVNYIAVIPYEEAQ